MNKTTILELMNKIDYNNDINKNVLNYNIEILMKYYTQLKNIFKDYKINNIILKHEELNIEDSNKIIKTLLSKYKYKELNKFIIETKKVIRINYEKITFYYLYHDEEKYENDKPLIEQLFKTSYALYKFQKNTQKNIIIIWIPINKKRNFNFDYITDENLSITTNNYEALTVGGMTYGSVTIIARYEEVIKLLLHELIHNFNLDGSKYNIDLSDFKKKYNEKKKKNYKYHHDHYESYTELLSSYFNILFFLINRDDIDKKILEMYIIIEILYSYNCIINLMKINKIDFSELNEKSFKGDICIYEYYYLKALMYNNFKLIEINNENDLMKMLLCVLKLNNDNVLLKKIHDNYVKNNNFKYCYLS